MSAAPPPALVSPPLSGAWVEEQSLDPANWDALRTLGHRMVDEMLLQLRTVRDRPVWQPLPGEVKAALRGPAPREGIGAEAAYADFARLVRPYPLGNIHPRFWGWVIGNGTPFGALADMVASGMNSNNSFGDHSAPYVEAQVIAWFRELLGFPEGSSGLITSSGSMSNFVALAVARDATAPAVLEDGVHALEQPLTVYASNQVHNCVDKAAGLLGLGRKAVRRIGTDDEYRIDLAALERTIAEDRAAGLRPIAVIGSAGTVNTGALDDLPALAEICRRHELWFHVDGAIGAVAAISDRIRPRIRGIELADSVAFDLHKWMYINYAAGGVLVRNGRAHRRSFSPPATYLAKLERGISAGDYVPSELGQDLSRGFTALKIWMSIKEHGLTRYARQIEQNVDQASYLGQLILAEPELELMAPVSLNIVAFRYRGAAGELDGPAVDALNQEILLRLQEEGVAAPSSTILRGRFVLRVAITNHRSRREDFQALVESVLRLGRQIRGEE